MSLPKLEEFCEECRPKAEKIYRYIKMMLKELHQVVSESDQKVQVEKLKQTADRI